MKNTKHTYHGAIYMYKVRRHSSVFLRVFRHSLVSFVLMTPSHV